MKLNSFQKELVSRIINNDFNNNVGFYNTYFADINFKTDYKKVQECYYKVIDYLILIQILKKIDLIYLRKLESTEFHIRGIKYNFVREDLDSEEYRTKGLLLEQIRALINGDKDDSIYPTEELTHFKKKRFKTDKERNSIWQRWFPIVIAIITIILSTLANYYIYTNQRKVTIENQKDIFKVIILDTTRNFKNDSLAIKP